MENNNEMKTNEQIKDRELNIFSMIVEKNQYDKVQKISMTTDKGEKITHKPITTLKEFEGAFQIEKEVQPIISELPPIFFEIASALKEKGKVLIKASYTVWNKVVDGEVTSIRYVNGNSIKAWSVV